ncbi:MAG: type II toxin-antitoxin system prevent-host-death family antitoxin [Coprothermobacterota bacterium]|nr:type II toxin-antitoxin system prevent-host-death family antitoxin [Coprothermobacterota bacterium]
MKTASVSKLKASLSSYLAFVQAGEEIVVTDRGKPIAKLAPIGLDQLTVSQRLLSLEKTGLFKIGRGQLPKDFWERPRPKDPEDTVLLALLQDREEGL